MKPRSSGRSVLTHLRCRLAVKHSILPCNYMADIHVRKLATSCTAPESSGPCEAGSPRITCVGKQRLKWVSQATRGQQGSSAQLGISSPEPSLSPTGPGVWAPDG